MYVQPSGDFSVNTPNINNLIALPFKKRKVGSSQDFRGVWSAKKDYVRSVSGKGGAYQENKSRRRSETFPWPETSSQEPGQIEYPVPNYSLLFCSVNALYDAPANRDDDNNMFEEVRNVLAMFARIQTM